MRVWKGMVNVYNKENWNDHKENWNDQKKNTVNDVMRMRGQWTCFLSLSLQRRKIFIYNMILDLDLIKLMNKM